VKLRSVSAKNRKRAFEVKVSRGSLSFPYAKADPRPEVRDKVQRVFVDSELGREAISYVLESGKVGSIHSEQILEYNEDPEYMRELLLYRLTIEAQKRVEASPLSKRELIRRLGTSATQLYRLLDQTNVRKSVDQMLKLLFALDCEVNLVVRKKTA